MQVVEMPIKDIIPYENNAKKHDTTQINNIVQSILDFGFVQPVVVDEHNNLIIGHGRTEAAKKLKLKVIPAVKLEGLTEEEVNKLRLLDNKLNESEWDLLALEKELAELDFSDFDVDFDLPEEENISPDSFGEDFSLPSGDKSEIVQMTFTLHEKQKELIEYALSVVQDEIEETFSNTNKNGNALYTVIKQWAEQKK